MKKSLLIIIAVLLFAGCIKEMKKEEKIDLEITGAVQSDKFYDEMIIKISSSSLLQKTRIELLDLNKNLKCFNYFDLNKGENLIFMDNCQPFLELSVVVTPSKGEIISKKFKLSEIIFPNPRKDLVYYYFYQGRAPTQGDPWHWNTLVHLYFIDENASYLNGLVFVETVEGSFISKEEGEFYSVVFKFVLNKKDWSIQGDHKYVIKKLDLEGENIELNPLDFLNYPSRQEVLYEKDDLSSWKKIFLRTFYFSRLDLNLIEGNLKNKKDFYIEEKGKVIQFKFRKECGLFKGLFKCEAIDYFDEPNNQSVSLIFNPSPPFIVYYCKDLRHEYYLENFEEKSIDQNFLDFIDEVLKK